MKLTVVLHSEQASFVVALAIYSEYYKIGDVAECRPGNKDISAGHHRLWVANEQAYKQIV